jgi:hypothetical protein
MGFYKDNRRADERYPYLNTIKHVSVPDIAQNFKGVTIDISRTGMCMYLFAPYGVCPGMNVEVRDPLPGGLQKGTVCWIEQVNTDLFRTGMMFQQ